MAAESLQVDQSMQLREFIAIAGDKGVAVDLTDAQVRGTLEFAPAYLKHKVDDRLRS